MRRNNGWLAVLAVSVVLSILRNSLAGERYPQDYGNDQLSVNRGKVAYGARGANGPSLNFQNRSNTPSSRYSSKLSSSSASARQTSHPLVKNDTTDDPSRAVSWRTARAADANQPDEDSGDDRSIRPSDHRERTRRLADRDPSDDCHEERRNKRQASVPAVPTARGSTGFTENSVKIPEEPRLSPRISRVAIKDTARRGGDATRRLTDPSTAESLETATLETAPGGSEYPDHEYPYYGHVEVDSRDDDSLKASRRENEDVRRQRGFTGELRGLRMEGSDRVDGQRAMAYFQGGDIEASRSLGGSGETATSDRNRYFTEIPESAVSIGKLFDAELKSEKFAVPGKSSGKKWSRGSVKRYLIDPAEPSTSVNQPLKIERLKLKTPTGRERLKGRVVGNAKKRISTEDTRNVGSSRNLWDVETEGYIQERYFSMTPKSSVFVNELLDKELKPKERPENRRRRNKSMYQLMSRRSFKTSRMEPDEETRTFNAGDIIKPERSYLWQNFGSSNRGPRSDRVEAVETEGRTHHSSEFEGSQRTSTSRKSTLTRGQIEYTRQLNGISAKQISTKGSDDEGGGKTRGNSSIREKRNIIPSNSVVALDSSQYGGGLSNVTFNETINDILDNDTDNDMENVEVESEFVLISENVTDNSLGDRDAAANVQQWNDSTLNLSTLTSSNEFNSISYDESTESVNRITLEKPDVSDGNDSQLSDISMLNAEPNSTLIERKFVKIVANSDNAQLSENVLNLSNATVSIRPDLSADSSQETELNAPRSETDETKEEANKATPEEASALSNVTKESEGVFVNSERSSVAATRNATYLRNDMNSLAERNYASESSGLSEFGERNSDNTFKNLSSMEQEQKTAEDIKINGNPEQSAVNKAKHSKSKLPPTPSERSAASKRVVLQKVEMKNRKIDNQVEWFDTITDSEAENDEVTFNDPLMVSRGQNSADSRTTELLNRNIQTRDDDIKPNEPSTGFSSKNERAQASSLDNGTVNEVNPFEKDEESIDGPLQRASSGFNSSSTMPTPMIDHPTRERKSRSSTARTSTSTSLKLDSTMKVEGPVSGQTSTPMWDKDKDHGRNVSTMQMESIPAKASNDSPGGLRVSLTRSLEFASSVQDSSTIPLPSDQPTPGSLDNYLNENLTFSSTEREQLPVTVETSTVELINDENQFSFAFDMVVSSSEPSDEYFPVTIDEASSQTTDNSSHEVEPPDQWPVKHSAVVEGDLVLGGLMMVHEREDTITCGPVMPQGGVQALEAMLYTLDRLNERGIVPGVKIGAHILDDCDKDTYGLEMAVDFIKD